MADDTKVVVGGLEFTDEKQAAVAKTELKRIDVLDEKLDYKNLDAVAKVYEKARLNHIFQTPVGISYMLRLQQYLISSNYEKIEIQPVSVPKMHIKEKANGNDSNANEDDQQKERVHQPASEEVWKSRLDAAKQREQKLMARNKFSLIVIAVLVVLVIGMFAVTLTSKHPNIINYKSNLISQYSEWQQELDQREQVIKQKENELNIVPVEANEDDVADPVAETSSEGEAVE